MKTNLPRVLVLDTPIEVGAVIDLSSSESAHLGGPLRRRKGDSVELIDGRGARGIAVLRVAGRRQCRVDVTSVEREAEPDSPGLSIGLAVLHTSAMDWALQKLVEIGVGSCYPVICERSQFKKSAVCGRWNHWQRISMQALKQCGRSWAMDLQSPILLDELIECRAGESNLVACRGAESAISAPRKPNQLVLVGPEGGFSEVEERALARADWARVGLGDFVLRADTAAVVAAALLTARPG